MKKIAKRSKVAKRVARKTKVAPSARRAGTVLVLRTCNANMSSAHDPKFFWPESGKVSAPDWSPEPECGHGLHGFLKGEGDPSLASSASDAKWLVVEVAADSIISLDDKVKFPSCCVLYAGDRDTAVAMVAAAHPEAACNWAKVTAGYNGTATAGDSGTATAGDSGTATAGDNGTATAGYNGTATAGDSGTATAGDNGTATAGYNGTIILKWYDSKTDRYRVAVGYVGEDGIEPHTAYKLDDNHKFIKAQ